MVLEFLDKEEAYLQTQVYSLLLAIRISAYIKKQYQLKRVTYWLLSISKNYSGAKLAG
jgi:hypothetical protein